MDKTPGQVAIKAWRECGNDFERKMEHVAAAVIAHARPQIEREAQANEASFKEAVIDALVVNHILEKEHETNPRKAIADLVLWEQKLALDPLVSSDAQRLIDKARTVAVEEFITTVCNNSTLPMSVCIAVHNAVKDLASAPAGMAVVPVDSPITAKPLKWKESHGQWDDDTFGFSILIETAKDKLTYVASWGEGDSDEFDTFKDAEAWCQAQADDFIRKAAMLAARPTK